MMDEDEGDVVGNGNGSTASRRILKVRLRQDLVIKLHEFRILQGKSIANLLEGILEDYFGRPDAPAPTPSTNGHRAELQAPEKQVPESVR